MRRDTGRGFPWMACAFAALGIGMPGPRGFADKPRDQDNRPHVVMIIAEDEYETDKTLPVFASKYLAKDFRVTTVLSNPRERNDLPGLEAVDQADLILVSVRRRAPGHGQLSGVRRFVAAGKPVVGIRTACHAFALRGNEKVPAGHDVWPTFDPDVLGGHYANHHKDGPPTTVAVADGARKHPILTGIDESRLIGNGSLYKVSPLEKTTTPLLIGAIPDQPPEPLAWTNTRADGGRSFFTSLGHPDDFKEPEFNRLLRNAIDWGLGRTIPDTGASK